jgi:cohesin domain-containing protein/PEP-CTERM motif-containing protein
MKKLFSSATFVLFMIVLLSPARTYADAVLSVLTPATVSQGSTFMVGVNISNVTDLFAFQFDLNFNPAVLRANSAAEGTFLVSGGGFTTGTIDNIGGIVPNNADTLIGAILGVSGAGTLVLFDFTALAQGTSAFTISNVLLFDSTLTNPLNFTTTGGSVTVVPATVVPEPSSLMLLGAGLFALLGLTLKKTVQ